MPDNLLPQQKAPKLIVVTAFDRDETGDLQPVFGPAEQHTEDRAIRTEKRLAGKRVQQRLESRMMVNTGNWVLTADYETRLKAKQGTLSVVQRHMRSRERPRS